MKPTNISESMIKSVLIRARYRDLKLEELKQLKAKLTFCCACENVITTGYSRCDRCNKPVCPKCNIEYVLYSVCPKCDQEKCVNCHETKPFVSLLSCTNCTAYMCKRCTYEGGDYDFCCKKCYDRYDEHYLRK